MHGSGPNDRDETIGPNAPFRDLAIGLAARGIASLRYEKRTLELGQRFKVEVPDSTSEDEVVNDAVAAIALLSKREEIGAVFVVGHSLGAALAPRIAWRTAVQGIPVHGIVMLAAPLTPVHRLIIDQYAFLASQAGSGITPEMIEDMRRRSGNVEKLLRLPNGAPSPGPLPFDVHASWWRDLGAYDPAATLLAQPKLPALLLFGGRDYQVPIGEKTLWAARVESRPHTTLREFPALNHLLMAGEGPPSPTEYGKPGKVADELIDGVANWIAQISARAVPAATR